MKNVDATFVDKTDQSDLTRREEYFRTKLRTFTSHRLNIEKYLIFLLIKL